MSADPRQPVTTSDVLLDVLRTLDAQGESTTAMTRAVDQQTRNIDVLTEDMRNRPTKLQAFLVLTIVNIGALLLVALLGYGVAESLRDGQAESKAAAEASEAAAKSNAQVLAELRPCNDGDDPNLPGCLRRARTEKLVADLVAKVNADLARGLAAHDLNTHEALEELRRRIARDSAPLPRQSPSPAPASPPPAPAAPPAPAVEPAPPAPPECERLPNGRCRK